MKGGVRSNAGRLRVRLQMADCLRIDARRISRQSLWVHHPCNFLHPAFGRVTGTIAREPTHVHVQLAGFDEIVSTREVVNPPHSVPRIMFECGVCDRLCRHLYLAPGQVWWACRICLGLSYTLENKSRLDRLFDRKHALQAKIDTCGPRAHKRKWRLWLRLEKVEDALIEGMRQFGWSGDG